MHAPRSSTRAPRRLALAAVLLGACLVAGAVPTDGSAQGSGQGVAGPTLIVVGFALADESPQPAESRPAAGGLQVNVNLQSVSPKATTALQRLTGDVLAVEAAARAAGVPAAAITQQAPQNLNYNAEQQQYTADATLVLHLKTLAGGARTLDRLNLVKISDVSDVWVNFPANGAAMLAPSAQSMATAYAAAFADAASAAALMATADHLVLGRQVSVTEGEPTMSECGMAGCNAVPVPGLVQVPSPGPDQSVVAVTVTYATTQTPTTP